MDKSYFPFLKETARRCSAERVLLLFEQGDSRARQELEEHKMAYMAEEKINLTKEMEGNDE